MKVIFTNGTELEYIEAIETSTFYDNATRRMLEFKIEKDAISLSTLNDILSNEENLVQLHLVNEEENAENYYNDYQIKMELSVKTVPTGEFDESGEEVRAERVIFKLGKLTYVEKQLRKLGL